MMARRSPTVVNQTYETGCTWRMFGIFNFREGHFNRRLVSYWRRAHATGDESSRRSSGVFSAVDEKDPHIGVSSRRRRDYGCKSISCVEDAQVADQGNKVTKMTIDQKFVNKNYQGKDGAGCQPEQLLDALQILYSNKELFLKLLQDPNSLLVKQIHDLQSSQVKEPYQAVEKKMTRLNKYQNGNARQCGKPFESFDRYDSSSSCEPQFSNKIVVLKPSTNNVKKFADTRLDSPGPHSPRSFSYNAQNIKPSHFPLGRIKRKLRYVTRVKTKEQQSRITDGVPAKFPCHFQGLQDGKKVKELEIAGGDSLTKAHASIEERLKDSELCMRKEVDSFGESCSRITNNASFSPSEQNTLNIPVEGRKSQSDMLKCGIEEFTLGTSSLRRMEPLPDFESLPSLQGYCKHGYVNEGMRYFDNYQMDHRTKLGLQKEEENRSYSALGLKIKDAPRTTTKTFSDKLHSFGTDTSIRESLPGSNLHAHYDIPRDGGYNDNPNQNFNKNNSTGGIESFQDSHPEIQIMSFSPEVASSSPSSCERIEDTINMSNRFEHPRIESVVEHFTRENVINPPVTTFQPDESPVRVVHDKFEENHLTDLIRSSLDPTNNLASSKDILNCSREILQVFSLKWDELVMKCESSDHLHDPSTFDELKGSICQLSSDTVLVDCVIETFMEVYQNCGFPLHIATKCPSVQAYVAKKVLVKEITEVINWHFLPYPSQITLEQLVGKDLARSGSWLNIQVDTEDIVIEVEEDVLENLVLEIISEMVSEA